MNQSNIDRFEQLLGSVKREGIENLIDFIRKSDFYTAPASTRYHSCHEGGLLNHSLNVYDCLTSKRSVEVWSDIFEEIPEETLIITALLHDVCKTYFYKSEIKNRKVYSDNGSKTDNNGKYDWESYSAYTIEDKIPYGHGEKSVMMIEEYIKLTPMERYAIRWHMGFSEPKENYNALGSAMKKYPLIIAIQEADIESTYLKEDEG